MPLVFVDDAPGEHVVEIGEDRLAHQLRMQGRDAVDLAGADEGEMAHAHPPPVILLDNGKIAQLGCVTGVARTERVPDAAS